MESYNVTLWSKVTESWSWEDRVVLRELLGELHTCIGGAVGDAHSLSPLRSTCRIGIFKQALTGFQTFNPTMISWLGNVMFLQNHSKHLFSILFKDVHKSSRDTLGKMIHLFSIQCQSSINHFIKESVLQKFYKDDSYMPESIQTWPMNGAETSLQFRGNEICNSVHVTCQNNAFLSI